MSKFELLNKPEYIKFRQDYKNYVNLMNSRNFAEMIIKEGGEKTRIKIILLMHECGINIPSCLLLECIKKNKHEYDYLKNYFKENNIDENNTKLNIEEYHRFKEYMDENYPYEKIVRFIEFKNYMKDKNKKKKKINNLTDLDCELMKAYHIS